MLLFFRFPLLLRLQTNCKKALTLQTYSSSNSTARFFLYARMVRLFKVFNYVHSKKIGSEWSNIFTCEIGAAARFFFSTSCSVTEKHQTNSQQQIELFSLICFRRLSFGSRRCVCQMWNNLTIHCWRIITVKRNSKAEKGERLSKQPHFSRFARIV